MNDKHKATDLKGNTFTNHIIYESLFQTVGFTRIARIRDNNLLLRTFHYDIIATFSTFLYDGLYNNIISKWGVISETGTVEKFQIPTGTVEKFQTFQIVAYIY